MSSLSVLRAVVDALSIALTVAFYFIVFYGMRLGDKGRDDRTVFLAGHKRSVLVSWIITGMIIAVVEFVAVPFFGRQWSNLLAVHLAFCALFILSFSLATIFNGERMSKQFPDHVEIHHVLGYIAFCSEVAVAFLGMLVVHTLHQ